MENLVSKISIADIDLSAPIYRRSAYHFYKVEKDKITEVYEGNNSFRISVNEFVRKYVENECWDCDEETYNEVYKKIISKL